MIRWMMFSIFNFPSILILPIFILVQGHESLVRPSPIRGGNEFQQHSKTEAFAVLQTKCNSCHSTKKRTDIFTLNNMDSLAGDIWKQVFVKKKMPKGKKVKLTETETAALRNWLAQTLAK